MIPSNPANRGRDRGLFSYPVTARPETWIQWFREGIRATPDWCFVGIPGAALLVIGVLSILWPGHSIQALVYTIGTLAACHGVSALIAAAVRLVRPGQGRPLSTESLIVLAAGVVTLLRPSLTEQALLYLIAGWAVALGLFELSTALAPHEDMTGEWFLAFVGLLTGGLGLAVVQFPEAGMLAFAWLFGVYSLGAGLMLVLLSMKVRRCERRGCWTHAG